MKTFVKILLGFLLLFLIALSVLGILAIKHQDKIEKAITEELNSYFENEIHIDKFHLTFINHFPLARLRISDISIQDTDKEILRIGSIQAFFDLSYLLQDSIILERLIISNGWFESIVDKNGKKPDIKFSNSKNKSQNKNLSVKIYSPHIELENFKLKMINDYKGNKTYVTINKSLLNLNIGEEIITITGDVDANLDSLISKTTVLFMNQHALAQEIVFRINAKNGTKKLENGVIKANNLYLTPRVSYQKADNGNIVKLRIKSSGGLDEHLKLLNLPEGLDFKQLNNDAKIDITYQQDGLMNAVTRPHNQLIFNIENANLSSPSLPNNINNIHLKGNYNNGEKHIPSSNNLIIDTLHIEVEDSYLNARLNLSNFSDPFVKGHFTSEIDLSHFFHQEKVSASGFLKTDIFIDSKIRDLRNAHFEKNEYARGEILIDSIEFHHKDSEKQISIPYGKLTLNNHLVKIDQLNGYYDKTHFSLTAAFNNVDRFILDKNELLNGIINFTSDGIDLNSFVQNDSLKVKENSSSGLNKMFLLPNLDLKFNIISQYVKGSFGSINDLKIKGLIKKDYLNVENVEFLYQNGNIKSNVIASFDSTGINSLSGKIRGNFDYLNIDKIPVSSQKNNQSSKLNLPNQIDLGINLNILNGVVREKDFSRLNINAEISNTSIIVESHIGDILGGSINLDSDIKFNDEGIWFFESMGDIHFSNLLASDLISLSDNQGKPDPENKSKSSLEHININLGITIDTLLYGNNTFNNINTVLKASRQDLKVDHFNIDLPQGHGMIDLSVLNYLDTKPKINGNIQLNFDSLNIESMFDAVSGFSIDKNKSTNKAAHIIPDNMDIKVDINAGKVIYKKIELNDMNFSNTIENGVFKIDELKFGFNDGNVNLSGLLIQNDDFTFSGHLYTKCKKLNIEPLFASLSKNDFYDGSHGEIKGFVTLDAEALFELDSSFNIIMNKNLFHCDILIEDGEIINNEQLDKTLSFIGHRAKEDILIDNTNIQIFLDGENLIIEDMYMNNSISNMNIFGKYYKYDSAIDIQFKISLTDLLFRRKEKRQVNTVEGTVKLDKDLNLFIGLEGSLKQNKIKVHPKRKHRIRREELYEEIKEIEVKYRTRLNQLYKKAEPKVQDSDLNLEK